MITTNKIEKIIYKLKDINRRFPEFRLYEEIDMFEKLIEEVNNQPTTSVQIAIIKSAKTDKQGL